MHKNKAFRSISNLIPVGQNAATFRQINRARKRCPGSDKQQQLGPWLAHICKHCLGSQTSIFQPPIFPLSHFPHTHQRLKGSNKLPSSSFTFRPVSLVWSHHFIFSFHPKVSFEHPFLCPTHTAKYIKISCHLAALTHKWETWKKRTWKKGAWPVKFWKWN